VGQVQEVDYFMAIYRCKPGAGEMAQIFIKQWDSPAGGPGGGGRGREGAETATCKIQDGRQQTEKTRK
jgi:hypothetical protein